MLRPTPAPARGLRAATLLMRAVTFQLQAVTFLPRAVTLPRAR